MDPQHRKYSSIYYGLRCGETVSEKQGVITDSTHLSYYYGLTSDGILQVEKSCAQMKEIITEPIFYFNGNYFSARRTAEIANTVLGDTLSFTSFLAQRGLGTLIGKDSTHYERLWREDARDVLHSEFGVESLVKLSQRLGQFLWQTEYDYPNSTIVVVAGQDVISALQCMYQNVNLRFHRKYAFEPGELRNFESEK